MKAFKFKLHSILTLRERAEDEAQQRHAEAGRKLDELTLELNRARSDYAGMIEKLEGVQRASFRPAERDNLWKSLKSQQEHCGSLAQKVDAARRELEHKRQALLTASTDRQAMRKMEEKGRREHTNEAQRQESSMIDEIVNARHTMRAEGGMNL